MDNQTISYQDDSLTSTVRVFLLGMAVAFLISIAVSYSNRSDMISEHTAVDCDNPASLSSAQDRSRNGIANACL